MKTRLGMLTLALILAFAVPVGAQENADQNPEQTPEQTPEGTPEAGPPPQIKIGHVGHDHQIALFVAALAPEKFKERFRPQGYFGFAGHHDPVAFRDIRIRRL